MRNFFLIIGTLLITSVFAGEIIMTNDFRVIEQVAEKLSKDSLVLFDVDATLIVPTDAILQPQGKELFKKLIADYTDRDLFREIRMKAPHVLVDERSIAFVNDLQERNIPVIALTAAPSIVKGVEEPGIWRVNELKKYGFDFRAAFPNIDYLEITKSNGYQFFPMFKSGVLYSSFHPKGDVLAEFLTTLNIKPNKVIFVDDELVHVESVVASLETLGIPCVGIHYTNANEYPYTLNPEISAFQIEYFVEHDIWLEDVQIKS